MTKYRLKDQELQKKLDEISNGDFSRALRRLVKLDIPVSEPICMAFGDMQPCGFADGFGNLRRFSICLLKDDLKIVKEYNPNNWNNYPDVTPPEGVLMRVEFIYDGILRRNCAIFENGAWYIAADRKALYDFTIDNVKRYRPWEGDMVWHKWPDKKPPELIELLVTHKTEKGELRIDKACFDPDEGWDGIIDMVGDVLAWAELPEPYKPD